jgi:Holliday junction resolvase
MGKYEEVIIQRLAEYFRDRGYEVVPHSRLNISWGSVISDVDLLLLKDGFLTYVEVKSCRDKIARAPQQVQQNVDFVDYAYVATERKVSNWNVPDVGLINIQENSIKIARRAKRFIHKPNFLSILTLKKKCLAKFFGPNIDYLMHVDKYELAQNVYTLKSKKCTRSYLREIVTCGESCALFCPITELSK